MMVPLFYSCGKKQNPVGELHTLLNRQPSRASRSINWSAHRGSPPPAVNISSASGPGAPPHPGPQTPKRHSGFIIRVAELSRVKAQERQRGPVAPAPFSAVGGPARAPKAQITWHIMRGLAQQAPLLFLSLSLTRTHTDRRTRRMRHYCWSLAPLCSAPLRSALCVLFAGLPPDIRQRSCFTCRPCGLRGKLNPRPAPCA